ERVGCDQLKLERSEMIALDDAAAPELKSVLDDDGDSYIERISFQYRSVVLVRPWFRSEVLTSRIWRSNEADLLLSDGAEPPYGCCPAYVSACVFVRRIVEVKKPTPGEGAGGSRTVPHFAVGAIRPERLVHRELRVDRSILATVAQRRKFAVARPLEPKAVASGSL